MKTCRKCGVELVVGETWTEGQRRAYSYICRKCNSEKGILHYKENAQKALESQRKRLSNVVSKKRDAEYKSQYYLGAKEKWIGYRETQKEKEATDPWRRASRMCTWVRARAGKTGREFDLSIEWIAERVSKGFCEITGIPFELRKPDGMRFYPFAPSIDRIDSTKGYTQDNCRVVVWIYNMAKSEWSDDVVMQFAKALAAKS